ncbi:hypothetical protein ACMGGR_09275 [Erwinia sp. BNK-24-b]|uniref:hypothetical protein n=1 Tax=unclassified Erwinia TaxID=2622719 RepID=UPI0039BED658
MSYNTLILKKLEAEKYLATILDKSVNEVAKQSIKHANIIYKGAERLSWYSSCFFKNYQDVCDRMKIEDVRFGKVLTLLVKGDDVLFKMIEVYVDTFTNNLSLERIRNIERYLFKFSAAYATNSLTNKSFSYTITRAIYSSFAMRATLNSFLTKGVSTGVTGLGFYGYVQIASEAAERLKQRNFIYYASLYNIDLEMLYFLIEDLTRNSSIDNAKIQTDYDIAQRILRLIGR